MELYVKPATNKNIDLDVVYTSLKYEKISITNTSGKTCIFVNIYDPELQDTDNIALCNEHRLLMSLAFKDRVLVEPVATPCKAASDVSITISKQTNLILNCDKNAFFETIRKQFDRHHMYLGQQFVVRIPASDGKFYRIKINVASVHPENNMITEKTQFHIRQNLSPKITFFESISTTDTVILNDTATQFHNLNLDVLGIGGLHEQFAKIFRRAFSSRLLSSSQVKALGIKHVKGIMLHGPPGTGKTTLAVAMAKMLNSAPVKIISGPEIFSKWVGDSEQNIRNLFIDAEKDQALNGDASQLHMIIIDEIDSLCKRRTGDTGGRVTDNIVNQLLAKMDGPQRLNNILLIGMTNRLDMIDSAILRPGRFEIQIEIGLPDFNGRVEILNIHTREARKNGYLTDDVDLEHIAKRGENMTGAELEGVVKSAVSFAISSNIDTHGQIKQVENSKIKVNQACFLQGLTDIKPLFGSGINTANSTIIEYNAKYVEIMAIIRQRLTAFKTNPNRNRINILVHGDKGCGKSALARHIASILEFPFVKIIGNDMYIGKTDQERIAELKTIYFDLDKSRTSVIILDDIERLLNYVRCGHIFSNAIFQTVMMLLDKIFVDDDKQDYKLCIIVTTAAYDFLNTYLECCPYFTFQVEIPAITDMETVTKIIGKQSPSDILLPITIQKLYEHIDGVA